MSPSLDKQILESSLSTPGLKIINFHAAHIAFNTPNFQYTRNIKDMMSREEWNNIDSTRIQSLANSGIGIRNILQYIIEFIFKRNHKIKTITEISEEFIIKKNISFLHNE